MMCISFTAGALLGYFNPPTFEERLPSNTIPTLPLSSSKIDELTPNKVNEYACYEIVWCPSSDWRSTDPTDVCVYGWVMKFSEKEPVMGSKGEFCVLIEKKNEMVEPKKK